MTPAATIVLAVVLPILAGPLIVLAGRRPNLREAVTLITGGGTFLVVLSLLPAVMAGGRPEYLPVLIAAIAGLLDPGLTHDKIQATSGSTFPVVIVNGPIAKEIRLNSGFGLLGPDPQHPAGASIGRAMRLIQQNVGGALPGV